MAYIDPVKVSPNNYKTLLENAHVRVLEMNLRAGEMDQMHSHASETVYFIKGGKVRFHLSDGGTAEAEPHDAGVIWHEEWTHQVENIGNSDIHAIIVESKQKSPIQILKRKAGAVISRKRAHIGKST